MSRTFEFVIRRGCAADLDALVALEQASFEGDRMRARQYRHHLASTSGVMLVAELADQRLAGSALVLFRRNSARARLYSLATAAMVRGRGVGARLLTAAEDVARQRGCVAMRLEVRCDNAAAIALYQRAGYRVIDTRAEYYEDGSDALRLEHAW